MNKFCMAVGMLAVAVTGSHAEVVATARSPEGEFPEFRVVLDAVGQPSAVANFMGLADGSQEWVDPGTRAVRGGGEDPFYKGMVFDSCDGVILHGGGRKVEKDDGTVAYTGGPGFTVLGKTNDIWTPFGWGALALAEGGGPHTAGSEVLFLLTDSVVGWTVFGRVAAGDEAGLAALASRVATNGVTEVRWEVDASGATEEEQATLAAAREVAPVPCRVKAQSTGGKITWPVPAKCRFELSTTENLMAEWEALEGWNEGGTSDGSWRDFGLEGDKGFAEGEFTAVSYPGMGGQVFTGKWQMWMEHSGQQLQYWFDFDPVPGTGGGTGLVALVEGGEIVATATFENLTAKREAANTIQLFYGQMMMATYYHLGFARAGDTGGRFMSNQIIVDEGTMTTDWGTFRLAEGWTEEWEKETENGTGRTERSGMLGNREKERRWLPLHGWEGKWVDGGIRLPDGGWMAGKTP